MTLKNFAAAAALACTAIAAPAFAQDAGVAAGATVYGPQGGVVGTIERVDGANVVVTTATGREAVLPADSFGEGANGPTIGFTGAQLDEAIIAAEQQNTAALDAALVAGTQLYSADGVVVGTVTEPGTNGLVVVEHSTAGPIQLPKDQMRMQGGNLTFLATAADLSAAVSAQAGAAPAATATAGTDAAVTGDASAEAGAAPADGATVEPQTGL